MTRVVIIGAGPAGVRAAETLVAAGVRPTVLDEAPASGGQIYRRPPKAIVRDPKALYGFEASRARNLHRDFDNLMQKIDYWPNVLVWGIAEGRLSILAGSGSRELGWDKLILATGAMDRVIPFEGWTLPGVFTLGGSQVALKYQACSVGEHPIFLGTGPLLYLVAYQYAVAGAKVAAVLDTSPTLSKLRALPGLLTGGRTFAKGLYYWSHLKSCGVEMAAGVRPTRVSAGRDGAVEALVWRDRRGRERRTPCDALAVGFGLRSETQIADLCGACFAFEPLQRQWLPVADADGRANLPGVYLAGDGAAIRGAEAAELSGQRAALAALSDLGLSKSASAPKGLNRKLRRLQRFSRALAEEAFPFPVDLAVEAADDLMVCRCEGVTAGELRAAARELGAKEINRVKAFTRLGMGRCQGRVCEVGAAEILADTLKVPLAAIGRLRRQAPAKPVPLGRLAGREAS